jgi:5'-phosphate synthase pdxT subunit
VGVLAVQGAFAEHAVALADVGAAPAEVRTARDLDGLDGLVIPGGESTTLGLVAGRSGLLGALREATVDRGLPVLGTCAGMIVLARATACGEHQPLIGGMDIVVRRNAFGRQVASFEADLDLPLAGPDPLRAVFIRAPWIETAGPDVEVLATWDGHAVAARDRTRLVMAFHPELTRDRRVHQVFVDGVRDRREGTGPAEVTRSGGARVRAQ